jgi:RNAse (barnase) inhibitor barstar
MATVRLNTNLIMDWASFHQVCKEAFGFPDFYGANMNAWIDCLSYLTEDDGMTRFVLTEDERLSVEIADSENFKRRLPEIFQALIDCNIFVNNRYETPKIALMLL